MCKWEFLGLCIFLVVKQRSHPYRICQARGPLTQPEIPTCLSALCLEKCLLQFHCTITICMCAQSMCWTCIENCCHIIRLATNCPIYINLTEEFCKTSSVTRLKPGLGFDWRIRHLTRHRSSLLALPLVFWLCQNQKSKLWNLERVLLAYLA